MDRNNKCNGAINSSGTSKVTTTTRAPANGIVDTKSVLQCRHGIVQQWLSPLVVYGIALTNCGHCVWLSVLIRILHAKSEMNPNDFGLESSSGFWVDIELWSLFCVNVPSVWIPCESCFVSGWEMLRCAIDAMVPETVMCWAMIFAAVTNDIEFIPVESLILRSFPVFFHSNKFNSIS